MYSPAVPCSKSFSIHFAVVPFREIDDLLLVDLERVGSQPRLLIFGSLDKNLVQLDRFVLSQPRIGQAEVNTRLESWVDSSDAVCREKQDSCVVFEAAQEHARNGISAQVGLAPLGQEHVCFIEQQYTTPLVGQCEVVIEVFLHFHGCLPNIAASDGIEWPSGAVCDTLCC